MRLRQETLRLYANSHQWYWFDDQANLWHPYGNGTRRIIDRSYHDGDQTAYCDINRRPYAIEFVTMTQINLVSMHRRPVLLFPSFLLDSLPEDRAVAVEPGTSDQLQDKNQKGILRFFLILLNT